VGSGDIVMLSNIDEIIESRHGDHIICNAMRRGVITIKVYLTMFHFNLYSYNWGGSPDYSYAIFVMTEKILQEYEDHSR
jgi:hypothetical protein